MESLNEKIYDMYDKKGYFSKYGGSLFMSIIIIIISFLIVSYYYVLNKTEPIKENWLKERCNPEVIPFGGLINKPKDKGAFEFTAENFSQCLNNTLISIVDKFFQPIYYSSSNINVSNSININALQNVRKMFNYLRNKISGIFNDIFSRLFNTIVPVQKMTIALKDALFKVSGILTSFVYIVMILFNMLKKFFGIILIATIVSLFIITVFFLLTLLNVYFFPFMAPYFMYIASVLYALFLVIVGYVMMLIVFAGVAYHASRTYKVPSPPNKKKRCFDEDTKLKLNNGKSIKIKNINVGDVLKDNSVVTSTFTLSSHGVNMYKYNNIIISGTHRVLYNKQWELISDIEDSELIDDYRKETIYCLNTSTKRININGNQFLDWDELDELSMITFKSNARQFISKEIDYETIHKIFDGGIIGDTKLELEDGTTKKIKDINVNEILRNGGRILGKIEIDTSNLDTIKKYIINNEEIIGGPNLFLEDDNLGKISTLDMIGTKYEKPYKLYHLITENSYFKINNISLFDYDSNIDIILGNNVETNELL